MRAKWIVATLAVAGMLNGVCASAYAMAPPPPVPVEPVHLAGKTGVGITTLGGIALGMGFALPTSMILTAGYVAVTQHRELTQKEATETFFGTLIPPLGLYYLGRDLSKK
ncbi:hypothetical protein [Roseixanthobacter glucoisosaccharinicivorans]|uniref:hypothetical protein n=1 Tax=Roseixanthobacter glucoisosaccharinicivorans TaxID=3119923 RepID=UPI00372B7635